MKRRLDEQTDDRVQRIGRKLDRRDSPYFGPNVYAPPPADDGDETDFTSKTSAAVAAQRQTVGGPSKLADQVRKGGKLIFDGAVVGGGGADKGMKMKKSKSSMSLAAASTHSVASSYEDEARKEKQKTIKRMKNWKPTLQKISDVG